MERGSVPNPGILFQKRQDDFLVAIEEKADIRVADKRDLSPGDNDFSPVVAAHGIQRNRNGFRHLEGLLTFDYQERRHMALSKKSCPSGRRPGRSAKNGANIALLAGLTTVFLTQPC